MGGDPPPGDVVDTLNMLVHVHDPAPRKEWGGCEVCAEFTSEGSGM